MKIVKRSTREKESGQAMQQWLAGVIGAIATTLPSFIIMPLWLAFIHNYKIVDEKGEENDVACALICFAAGVLIWIAIITLANTI